MVLQKYVDLKGIKKHSAMCRKIGMKPDTFSAILRGKYKDVKKDYSPDSETGKKIQKLEQWCFVASSNYRNAWIKKYGISIDNIKK